jgi:NTE family protein
VTCAQSTGLLAIAALLLALPWGGTAEAQAPPSAPRPKIGIAFGGGSARGIAHVGVIRWLEEHHIPIDVAAGTSMGGLIGGTFATGMSADEIETLLAGVDWDATFGSSNFEFKNVRRKRDARDYPSHLEFGLKRGIKAPTALNNGQQVDLLIGRITASSYALGFDELPTPFRAVAVDLRTAKFIVLAHGSLATAMRATMSIPLVFPPIEFEEHVLVDGGAMNNIPADVARSMGADRVIAVNVGDLTDLAADTIDYQMLGLGSETLDAMMRANSLKALASADVVINVPLAAFGSLDWRRYSELIAEGYKAAEAMRDTLLPLAVDDEAWQAWVSARAARRKTTLPTPMSLVVDGVGASDANMMRQLLEAHVGHPLDLTRLDADLTMLAGLDRYQSLTWRVVPAADGDRLEVHATPKKYGPPFVYLGTSLENTTSDSVSFNISSRFLAYDVGVSGSEFRFDVALGSQPSVATALYVPLGSSPFFVEPFAGVHKQTLNYIQDDHIVATYGETRAFVGFDVGFNAGRLDDVRLRARASRLDGGVQVGDPGLPDLSGAETVLGLRWTHDGQDSPVVPSRGLRSRVLVDYFASAPGLPADYPGTRKTEYVTQAEWIASSFWSVGNHDRSRVFLSGGGGTSFDGHPLPTEQFALGGPFRLGAYNVAEQRGDHYLLATGGYLRQVKRLPDFLGGDVFLGGWLDNGAAFNEWQDANWATQASLGVIADTLLGPAFFATSAGFDGRWRFYIGLGRVLR